MSEAFVVHFKHPGPQSAREVFGQRLRLASELVSLTQWEIKACPPRVQQALQETTKALAGLARVLDKALAQYTEASREERVHVNDTTTTTG